MTGWPCGRLRDSLRLEYGLDELIEEFFVGLVEANPGFAEDLEAAQAFEPDQSPPSLPDLVHQLYLSSLYEVDYFPLAEFVQLQVEDSSGNVSPELKEALEETVLLSPAAIEENAKRVFESVQNEENTEEALMAAVLLKKSELQADKAKIDFISARNLEVATLTRLMMLSALGEGERPKKGLRRQLEGWAEALSLHYAFDLKPSTAFMEALRKLKELAKEPALSLVEIVIEFCHLEGDCGEKNNGESGEDENDRSETTPLNQLPISQHRLSQTRPPIHTPPTSVDSPSQQQRHWSRIKQKGLNRRNTDTDFTRLVDFPPMPPRLGRRSTSFDSPKSLEKRKAVLIKVGEIEEGVFAWETPLKKRPHNPPQPSQPSQTTLSSNATTLGGTEDFLTILETPPRASVGAATSIAPAHTLPSKLVL